MWREGGREGREGGEGGRGGREGGEGGREGSEGGGRGGREGGEGGGREGGGREGGYLYLHPPPNCLVTQASVGMGNAGIVIIIASCHNHIM